MKLLYNGTLDPQTSEYVVSLLKEYPCVVEVKLATEEFWRWFHDWSEKKLPKHNISIESGSTGEHYSTQRVLYGLVRKRGAEDEVFIFFKTSYEKQLFTSSVDRVHIARLDPFQTVLEG